MRILRSIMFLGIVVCACLSTKAVVGQNQASTIATDPETAKVVAEIKALNIEVVKNAEQGKYEQGLLLAKKSLEISERKLGASHPNTADCLSNLAFLHYSQINYSEAIPLLQRALKIREQTVGPDHLDTALSLNNLALLYKSQANNTDALPLFQRALKIREKLLDPNHPDTASSLHNLAALYKEQGKYAEALPLYQRALKIREVAIGPNHVDTARSLDNLAALYCAQENYVEALALCQRAVKIKEQALGPDHPDTATSLNNLAAMYDGQANFAEALPLYQRALKIKEQALGPFHPDTATSLNNLAELYSAQGNFVQSLPLHQRALRIREKSLGLNHPETADSLNNLAALYKQQGKYAEALPLAQRALSIYQKAFGTDHPLTATGLNNLAGLYSLQNKYAEALPLYQRALKIAEKVLGTDHPNTATSLSDLALVHCSQGKYDQAIPLLQRALKIKEQALGLDHPDTAVSLSNLAIATEESGGKQAEYFFHRGLRALVAHCGRTLPSLSAKEQELFVKENFKAQYETALSQSLLHPDQAAMSAAWPLNAKGFIQDVLSMQELAARDIDDPKLGTVVTALQNARQQLAAVAMKTADAEDQAKRREAVDRLTADVDRLSRELAQATGLKIVTGEWIELDELRKAMRQNAVFVDITRIDVFDFESKSINRTKPAHYAAWVTPATGKGDVRLIDLGPASEIEALIEPIRIAMEPRGIANINAQGEEHALKSLDASMQKLAHRIWKPIQQLLGDASQVILSPDGALWLVPWTALPVDSSGQLVIEKFSIRFVTSGREVLPPKTTKLTVSPPLIFADPNFDSTSADKKKSIEAVLKTTPKADDETLRSFAAKSLLPKVKRLPNTATEAKFIQPSIDMLTGSKATLYESQFALESIAKKASRPKVIVFATHGFFLPTQEAKLDNRRTMDFGNASRSSALDTAGKPIENPLLRCGLLLAGCNNREAVIGDDDGILTGVEIVGIDFRGTDLVVLSACETGVGDIKIGEGVAGLRQAFQLAGAKAVVASLWQVPDRDSAIIMNDFFANLATGSTATEAMQQSQLKRIEARRKQFGAAHPIYWAAWTVTE